MPQGGGTWQGRDSGAHHSPDPGRTMEPSEKSTLPRAALCLQTPDISALTFRRRREFSRQRQARSYPGLQS